MDVRCEKCQTEYELDEARLKPGGVTVKCTNCGHMFKIRKRSTTNVGAHPAVGGERPTTVAKAPTTAQRDVPPPPRPSDASFDEPTRAHESVGEDRQWLIRLENGEQKSCRELAMLQQWIVAGVVTRESLISRTGKTWKRIGDITELAQYFSIADEARSKRASQMTKPTPTPQGAQTMLGVGASAAGGTILPDDDIDQRTTGNFRARGKTQPPPVPPKTQTPVQGTPAAKLQATAQGTPAARPATAPPAPPAKLQAPAQGTPAADVALASTQLSTGPVRRPPTQPPPPPVPAKKEAERPKAPSVPEGNRATAAWATEGVAAAAAAAEDKGPQGPFGGKIKVQTEPGFAGRVRVEPGESTAFQRGGKVSFEDDEEVMPARKGSKAGWIMLVVLLLAGGGAAAAYFLVLKDKDKPQPQEASVPVDAAEVVAASPDADLPPPTFVDAPAAAVAGPLDLARAELAGDREGKLREALTAISSVKEPGADALRAYITGSIAQQLLDRAAVTADRSEADKLKKEAKTVITDALGPAQKAVQAASDDLTANLAMATVLRVQGKSARDIKKYTETAKAKATPETKRDVVLAEALVLVRDGKLDDAKALLAPLDANEDKMETSGDVRVRLRLALIAFAQNKPEVAKPLVDSVLALAPDHVAAKTLADRLQTTVATSDPLPPEDDPGAGSGSAKPPVTSSGTGSGGSTPVAVAGDSYDKLLAKANTLAERNCSQALELFAKALEQKPNGVEALTGMGYCHVDAKQFSAAYSKFRAALAISSRYEPALWGIAETYLQQGRKENAIEAVKAYIDVHGEAPKAKKALERLGPAGGSGGNAGGGSGTGGSTTPPDNGGGGGSAAPAPPPPAPAPAPTPTPTPTPAPEGAGSGSG
ncbi:MAG: zinc-ribbon domain-containing protein [Kofleriaceae bacterium]|nr:zinc-ribbon domain-containing protein [Kofleriaceae bacterium]